MWIVVYFFINVMYLSKHYLQEKIHQLYLQGSVEYNVRRYLKVAAIIFIESIHFSWQLYGNFIYFEDRDLKESTKSFEDCMDERNPGFQIAMLLILMIGYSFMLVYAFLIFACVTIYLNKRKARQGQLSESNRILKSLQKIKFTRAMLAGLDDDNECIICLTPYQEKDTIIRLGCNEKHYFHTQCIESWIKQGKNQCPICR